MNRLVKVVVLLLGVSGSAWAQSSKANASRVDFDDQLVQGQVNKGAVHLIERKDSDLGSLVKKRTSYRREILAGTAVAQAKPVQSVARATPAVAAVAVPVLPVVKPSELKGEAAAPKAVPAPAATPAPAKSVVPAKPAAAAKTHAKPAPAKSPSKQTKPNGGSRVLSRR